MADSSNLNQVQKKAFLSTVNDGITEIFIGTMLFIAGIMFFNIYTEFIIAFFIVLIRLSWPKISKKIKEDYIYPRIGYVELRPNHRVKLKQYHMLFAVVMTISIITFFILVFIEDLTIDATLKYVPLIVGCSLLGKSLYYYIFSSKWNYLLLGLCSLSLAIAFILLPFSSGKYHIIFYAWFQSALTLIFGIRKLSRFMKSNPIIEEIEEV